MTPLWRWVGGKRWLADRLLDLLPPTGGTYYEPFVGAGALFWAMRGAGRSTPAVLADANPRVALAWQGLAHPLEVDRELRRHEAGHAADSLGWYRAHRERPESMAPPTVAAWLIYVTRAAWNGLYRENASGAVNSPPGTAVREGPLRLPSLDELLVRLHTVGAAEVWSSGYWQTLKRPRAGDVVYLDPPYIPASSTARFYHYTAGGFGLADQQRLAARARQLVASGVYVLASNSDTALTRELWAGMELHEVRRRGTINAIASKRGPVGELLIVGRP